MKIFLTGATGFIGRPLTRALIADGWNVVALVRKPDGPQACALTQLGAQCAEGDVSHRESMRIPMTGADIVIHNAGHYEFGLTPSGRQRMQATNVCGTENVLGLALELGIRRSIYVSTVLALGDSGPFMRDENFTRNTTCRSTYERTKTEAHAIASRYQQRGLPLIIVCPNGVIGANDHSIWGYYLRMYINNVMPPVGWSPHTMFALVEVNDLVRGIVLVAKMGRPGESYLLCGEPLNMRQHLKLWGMRPGTFQARLWLPANLMKFAFWPLEPLQRAFGLPAIMSRETVSVGTTNLCYSSEKAKHELGWTHKPAQEMWLNTLDGEIELQKIRKKRDLVSRLNPVESDWN